MRTIGWSSSQRGDARDEAKEEWLLAALDAAAAARPARDLPLVYAELEAQWDLFGRAPPGRRVAPGKHSATAGLARAGSGTAPAPAVARSLPTIHRDGDGEPAPYAAPLVARAIAEAAEQLEPIIRARLEAMFGVDLSSVRVHRGEAADQAAAALGARAFTIGRDVCFRDGAYQPGTAAGDRLIAHEVAHTQQPETAASADLRVTSPGDAAEREADAVADRFAGLAARPAPADRAPADRAPADRARPARGPAVRPTATRTAAVARTDDGPTPPFAIPPGGEVVDQVGIVAWDGTPALRLRATPATTDGNVLGNLAFNTSIQVIKRFPGDWLFVSTRDGRMGYVAATYVWTAPAHPLPEPGARLHRVQAGVDGTAIGIAERYYGAVADDWGQDLRFYVNVLAHVNHLTVPDSVDGWRSVRFTADQFIWIPTRAFARSLRGVVSSGSTSYEAADAIGIAGAMDRVGELLADFRTAIGLSGQFIPAALARHAEAAILSILQSLALMAVGAIAVLAVSTAVGALIGAAAGALAGGVGAIPGAAAGAATGLEVGFAIVEWLGLGFLVAWIGSSLASIGAAFGTFIRTVWGARGDQAVLQVAAYQFADALGVLLGVLLEALVMWAVGQGLTRALAALRGTPFGRAFGETRLGQWLGERIARYNRGETTVGGTPVRGPREVLLRAQASELATRLGLAEADALALLRALDRASVDALHEQFGVDGLRLLATRSPALLEAFARALEATGADPAGRASLMEGLRLNDRGTLSSQVLADALAAYVRFRGTYGDRVSGDFMSRFWRQLARNMDPAQAAAELRLAEDLLAGRTPLGEVGHVEALPESAVPGERVPEYRATTPEGARLVENKAIGTADAPLTDTTVGNNARSAAGQIRDMAARTGDAEGGGLVRLDGREAGLTDVTPETLADWVSRRIPSPRGSRATQWVEIFYRNAGGQTVRVVLELEGTRFVLRTSEVVP